MISHKPWKGEQYNRGIGGRRTLIAGFSHWGRDDNDDFTVVEVGKWAAGDEPHPFGSRIRSYFGINDAATFWHSVAFINTLPSLVGTGDQRYSGGSTEQRGRVKDRVRGVIAELKPNLIFVFSRRGWNMWPEYSGEQVSRFLEVLDAGEMEYGPYEHASGRAWAYSLPHPQFAATESMKRLVEAAFAHDPERAIPDREWRAESN